MKRLRVLTPNVSIIGNCCEEILFGLIRARQEGGRLLMLRPFDLPWKFRFPIANREVFDVLSPHRWDAPRPVTWTAAALLTALYGPANALTRLLGGLFGPRAMLPGRWSHPALGVDALWRAPAGFDWTAELQKPLAVGLRPEKRARAHAARLAMGLPEDAWFVGVHVRESGFYRDTAWYSYRNADIADYIPAMKEIADRGGWVVRLGDASMKPLPPMERVIDYPHTRFKNPLMDLYLLSECRFYLGMTSGILDTAWLFQRPMVLTNMTTPTFVHPRRPGDRGLLKHLYCRSKNRFLSVREVYEAPWAGQHFHVLGRDYEMAENSAQEIRDAVAEFMDGPLLGSAAPTPLQAEANRKRVEHGRRLLQEKVREGPPISATDRRRIATRLESALGSLSQGFLERNWERSSRS